MKLSRWFIIVCAIGGLAVTVFLARHKQRVLIDGLPPRIVCVSNADALTRAGSGAIPVAGTGSLAPFIAAAPPGSDPVATIMAYAVIDQSATFEDIRVGTLCIYSADWTKYHVMHQASAQDSLGWIGSGLNNAHSEAAWRITPQNFVGIVARVYVWPQ